MFVVFGWAERGALKFTHFCIVHRTVKSTDANPAPVKQLLPRCRHARGE